MLRVRYPNPQVNAPGSPTTSLILCYVDCKSTNIANVVTVTPPPSLGEAPFCGASQTAIGPQQCTPVSPQICDSNGTTFQCDHPLSASATPITSSQSSTPSSPSIAATPTSSSSSAVFTPSSATVASTPFFAFTSSSIGASSSSSETSSSSSEASSSSLSFATTAGSGNITSSSNTPKPAKSHVGKSSGITGGAAAGIAIGCLIAGAAIAALVFFFLFKRYKKRQQAQSAAYNNHLGPYNGAAAATSAEKSVPIATATAVSQIDALLPQPAEDDAITGELSRLRDKIKNHALTFYHTAAVDPVMVDESEFQDVARVTGIRSMTLCDMLLNPQTRIATIRLFLSYAILSRCGGQGGAGASLLPPEVGLFADTLAGTDGSNAGQLALKSKWHSISGTLLASRYNSTTISDSDTRSHSIAATITAVDGVLRPFVNSHQDDAQRIRNLQGVIQRAASFAFLLFSQPSTFVFQWSAHGKLAVFPALLQTSDENARVLDPPRVFANMETA
ncbi:uncharacterized protein BDZ99DRAFT_466681 [Mytilinidion resinicola]|uniref:Uncharacterized protein n=1 Tax=Mytilinidion resinicola TaxID=574789 RepID=A0A6A6YD53_9PEZI|nr:uncharacterized protein BDZ99DRAFT_466681 [Mytilinidion resinicola]KAF2805767.1 hypothetical protein BDZ99DRAFT_466681 [Mytilinidion resinicola]